MKKSETTNEETGIPKMETLKTTNKEIEKLK
jgi:hypothetical protein